MAMLTIATGSVIRAAMARGGGGRGGLPGRRVLQPLHIAAMRDESDDAAVCKFLILNGAGNTETDAGGALPSKLAEKRGNKASKDKIEEMTGSTGGDATARSRRWPRASGGVGRPDRRPVDRQRVRRGSRPR